MLSSINNLINLIYHVEHHIAAGLSMLLKHIILEFQRNRQYQFNIQVASQALHLQLPQYVKILVHFLNNRMQHLRIKNLFK